MSALLDSVSALRLPIQEKADRDVKVSRQTIVGSHEQRTVSPTLARVETNVPLCEQIEVLRTLAERAVGVYRRLATEMTVHWQPLDWDWTWCNPEVAYTLKNVMNKKKSKQLFVSPKRAGKLFEVHRTTIARYFDSGRIAGCYVGNRLFVVVPSIAAFLNRQNQLR